MALSDFTDMADLAVKSPSIEAAASLVSPRRSQFASMNLDGMARSQSIKS